jgi:Spy/CpxP family protein refolding chaperone
LCGDTREGRSEKIPVTDPGANRLSAARLIAASNPIHSTSPLMKSSTKILISLAALAIAGASFVRAADDVQTPLPPPPAAPDAPPPGGGPGGKGGMRGRDIQALKEKLNLTDAEVKQIMDIRKSHMEDLKAARGDREKMGEVMKTIHDETRAVLTPDQQKTFDAMPPPGRRGGKNKDGDSTTPPPPPPPSPSTT